MRLLLSLRHHLLRTAWIATALFGIDLACADAVRAATQEKLYTQKSVVRAATDPAFAAYWRDKADDVDFKASPQVYSARFTDADGRSLLISMIHAPWPVCSIFGCPVRIQTPQGESVLDHISACDLAEEHHLSADGRTFIACDEEFPIAGPGRAIKATVKRLPDYNLYGDQHNFESPKDPIFAAFWSDLGDDLMREPSPPAYRSIYVGHFVDAEDRKLVATTLHDPAECGLQVCPIRIYTEAGERLLDSIACSEPAAHRISTDRRHLIACGQALKIPGGGEPDPQAKSDAALPATVKAASQLMEKIPYDSGADLDSPKVSALQEYWRDKVAQINWKAPVSERGTIYNWPLPSADGRLLILTMLQSEASGVCNPLCPARVFTSGHAKIMDILVCRDRTQHGVSVDHRSFVACGETFPDSPSG